MSDSKTLSVKPIVHYPHVAQVGKTYLMTIDLHPEKDFEWQYEEEDYPIYCNVDSDLFSSQPVGEPVIVLHRFGGSYGSSNFLLTALFEVTEGEINITLVNRWGVLIKQLKLSQIKIENSVPSLEEETTSGVAKSDKIARIIERRQVLVSNLERTHTNLSILSSRFQELKEYRAQLLQKFSNQSSFEQLRRISFDESQAFISDKIVKQRKIIKRFSRNTINIGVVGRARQGKSRLIQSLSGLSSEVIPTGNRGICTAVHTTVFHHPQTEAFADIWFHSENSFLNEVIKPYYERLQLNFSPETLDAFANNPLPNLPNASRNTVSQLILYEELRKYHGGFDKYKNLLNIASPQRISRQRIRDFVTQDSINDDYVSLNHLAVKEVKISSPFPNSNAARLALIDMPGLGDTHVGRKEKLLENLCDDADIVLFVRRPDPVGDAWQVADLDLCSAIEAVSPSLLSTCSFMILNRTKGDRDNMSICEHFADDMPRYRINVVSCIIADCADYEEVNHNILDTVIDFLNQNIVKIDEQRSTAYQSELNELQEYITLILNDAKLAINDSNLLVHTSTELFYDFWSELTNSLMSFLQDVRSTIKYTDIFSASIYEVIHESRNASIIPTVEIIELTRARSGSYVESYNFFLTKMRTEMSRRFIKLDNTLKQISEDMKNDASNILIENIKKINLAELIDKKGAEFLTEFTESLPPNAENLRFGIQALLDFNITYSVFLQPRIRECFVRCYIDNSLNEIDVRLLDSQVLHNILTATREEVINDCEQALLNSSHELNRLLYAALEEFIDCVIRTEGARDEWNALIYENNFYKFDEIKRNFQQLITDVEVINISTAGLL